MAVIALLLALRVDARHRSKDECGENEVMSRVPKFCEALCEGLHKSDVERCKRVHASKEFVEPHCQCKHFRKKDGNCVKSYGCFGSSILEKHMPNFKIPPLQIECNATNHEALLYFPHRCDIPVCNEKNGIASSNFLRPMCLLIAIAAEEANCHCLPGRWRVKSTGECITREQCSKRYATHLPNLKNQQT